MTSKDAFCDLQFDGYRDFRRKAILAVAGQENKHAALAGPRLLQRLQGEAWRATEHLRIADVRKSDGWLEVIHALDRHYKFLPETELHEAVEEFLFHMKRKPGEGATSFSSRFRTQLDRVQTLIAQDRALHRERKSKRRSPKKKAASQGAQSSGSSVAESSPSEEGDNPFVDPMTPEPKSHSESESGLEAKPDGPAPSPPSKASSVGSKRDRDSQISRGTHKADREKEDPKMLEKQGSLEHGHLKPKPIFPQAI